MIKKMNIIFLDIDGVLNCQTFYESLDKKERIDRISGQLCKMRVSLLNDLCEDINAKVVISSTWRHSGLEYCVSALKAMGATFDIIDITPSFKSEFMVRGNEIYAWIINNKERIGCDRWEFNTYAIIDDDSDMLLWQQNNFFKVDNYSGLTHNTTYKIKNFFKSIRAI